MEREWIRFGACACEGRWEGDHAGYTIVIGRRESAFLGSECGESEGISLPNGIEDNNTGFG